MRVTLCLVCGSGEGYIVEGCSCSEECVCCWQSLKVITGQK